MPGAPGARDMESLPQHSTPIRSKRKRGLLGKHPKGFFPTIPIDQAHEQNNELGKVKGGAVGPYREPSFLQGIGWLRGRSRGRLPGNLGAYAAPKCAISHEEGLSTQKTSEANVGAYPGLMNGKTLQGCTPELPALYTGIHDHPVFNTVRTVEPLAKTYNIKSQC
ncbi:hypothetical protein GWK47_008045 [Chionoecetes opilio]|uniref:Uncharacterized protein n=1 Tax=Chionoecetes opilio TaxID=41210 RepID=A0A8J4Y6Z4_CHIOP|nr:hypothetical protein GWK47_008045 [Chionoecetes opilio]